MEGPTCVGTLCCTGFKAFVRDVVNHVDKVGNCGQLSPCHKVDRAVLETRYDVFDECKAGRIDAEFGIVAQGFA